MPSRCPISFGCHWQLTSSTANQPARGRCSECATLTSSVLGVSESVFARAHYGPLPCSTQLTLRRCRLTLRLAPPAFLSAVPLHPRTLVHLCPCSSAPFPFFRPSPPIVGKLAGGGGFSYPPPGVDVAPTRIDKRRKSNSSASCCLVLSASSRIASISPPYRACISSSSACSSAAVCTRWRSKA